MTKNEIKKIEEAYPVFSGDIAKELAEISEDNIGGEQPSLFDLERIKLVPGGVPGFQVIDPATGEERIDKEIVGVIIGKMAGRSYWESEETDGPPDCSGKDGVGSKFGDCESCEFNQWESDPKGGPGKACKEYRALLILRGDQEDGAILPSLLMVPPGSLKSFTGYMFGLTGRRLRYRDVETRITTEKKNARGNDYSILKFAMTRKLEIDGDLVQKYASSFLSAGLPSGPANNVGDTVID